MNARKEEEWGEKEEGRKDKENNKPNRNKKLKKQGRRKQMKTKEHKKKVRTSGERKKRKWRLLEVGSFMWKRRKRNKKNCSPGKET